jgi:hypothetical protein
MRGANTVSTRNALTGREVALEKLSLLFESCLSLFPFFVNDGRIYVFRFPWKKQYEVYILDLKGNILERKFMPTNDLKVVNSKYQCMSNGNLYQLRLGADEEEELHEIKIYR